MPADGSRRAKRVKSRVLDFSRKRDSTFVFLLAVVRKGIGMGCGVRSKRCLV